MGGCVELVRILHGSAGFVFNPAAKGSGNLCYPAENPMSGRKDPLPQLGCQAGSQLCQEHPLGEFEWSLIPWTTFRDINLDPGGIFLMHWPCLVQCDSAPGAQWREGTCSQEQAVIYGSSVPSYVSTVVQGEYKITDELQGGPDGRQ